MTMSGTEWTEPGQLSATLGDLFDACERDFPKIDGGDNEGMAICRNLAATRSPAQHAYQTMEWDTPTNLRLTGEPLTAEDLKRIAECR